MNQTATQSTPKVVLEPGSKVVPESGSKVTPEYREAVTKMADERKNQRFLNDSEEHAMLLAELMIGRADKTDDVLIYSRKLPLSCYGNALKLTKSANIRVILDDPSGLEEIKRLPDSVASRITPRVLKTRDGSHFFIAKDSFRLEMDHDKATAVANFNEPQAVNTLRSRFETLWSIAA